MYFLYNLNLIRRSYFSRHESRNFCATLYELCPSGPRLLRDRFVRVHSDLLSWANGGVCRLGLVQGAPLNRAGRKYTEQSTWKYGQFSRPSRVPGRLYLTQEKRHSGVRESGQIMMPVGIIELRLSILSHSRANSSTRHVARVISSIHGHYTCISSSCRECRLI